MTPGGDAHRGVNATGKGDLGASLVEYALLIALIALAAFLSLQFFGSARNNSLSRSGSAIEGVVLPYLLR